MSQIGPATEAGVQAYQAIIRQPQATLLAVDFDGTLSPITDDPDEAYAAEAAVTALGRVGALIGTVAVITGRPATTAVRLGGFRGTPGLETMVLLGQYGVERWDAKTDTFAIPPEPEAIAAVAEELPPILDSLGLSDVRIEHKGRAIGVHTRGLAEPAAAFEKLVQPLNELADRHDLLIEPGRNVLEIRAPGTDKGSALRTLVAETGARQVIFAGDDLGDLPAFRAVVQLRTEGIPGLLICSASREEDALAELADLVVDGTDGVAGWLTALGEVLERATSC